MSVANSENEARYLRESLSEQDLASIRDALRGLRFGVVNIVVQDGVIVQIDRTDKRRIRRDPPAREARCDV